MGPGPPAAGKEGVSPGLLAGATGGGTALLLLVAAALGLLWRRRRAAAPGRASLADVELAHLWGAAPDEGKAGQGGGARDSFFFGALWGSDGARRGTEMFVNPLAALAGGDSDPADAGGAAGGVDWNYFGDGGSDSDDGSARDGGSDGDGDGDGDSDSSSDGGSAPLFAEDPAPRRPAARAAGAYDGLWFTPPPRDGSGEAASPGGPAGGGASTLNPLHAGRPF